MLCWCREDHAQGCVVAITEYLSIIIYNDRIRVEDVEAVEYLQSKSWIRQQ